MSGQRELQWQQLHDRHATELWRFTLSLTHDRQVAEDIVQEVLLRAWRSEELAGRDEAATRAWLFTVARRLVIDRWRSAPVRREQLVDGPEEQRRTGQEFARTDQTDELLDRWLIAEALTDLSAEHRAVVIAAYYQGRTTADTAARLQIAEGTVKSRLHYGLRHLRMILQEKGVTRP